MAYVVYKLAETELCPISHVINKDIKQYWPQYQSLKGVAGNQPRPHPCKPGDPASFPLTYYHLTQFISNLVLVSTPDQLWFSQLHPCTLEQWCYISPNSALPAFSFCVLFAFELSQEFPLLRADPVLCLLNFLHLSLDHFLYFGGGCPAISTSLLRLVGIQASLSWDLAQQICE